MAFDYGSLDLGIRNPFKKEGLVTAIRGGCQIALGVYLLLTSINVIQVSAIQGWLFVLFSAWLLIIGTKALGFGLFATFRYFVGRNHPTSLAFNFSKSEKNAALSEQNTVGYTSAQIEEMMMGRKNISFTEPVGFLARLFHSFVPKLLFMPYLIRNLSQSLFSAWIKTFSALFAYALVAFVSLTGLAGNTGKLAFPIYSILLLFYVLSVWIKASRGVSRQVDSKIESLGAKDLVGIAMWAMLLPVSITLITKYSLPVFGLEIIDLENYVAKLPSFHIFPYLFAVLTLAIISTVIIVSIVKQRLLCANPTTEVSELRENWQESIHPNEIFINLENLVLANLRYKEVPNRVYHELNPTLNEQVENKGDFKGKVIQEIQPKFKPMEFTKNFYRMRISALIGGNLLLVISSLMVFYISFSLLDVVNAYGQVSITKFSDVLLVLKNPNMYEIVLDSLLTVFQLALFAVIAKSFGKILAGAAHIFFAEMQFESLLVYFKCEGTFSESTITTGASIHDSTRSDNKLVRSSMTPWIIVSRIVTTTFSGIGMKNLEYPRHILEMNKCDDDLKSIKSDIMGFLQNRESIASISNERDLGNASQILDMNNQSRDSIGASLAPDSNKSITKDDKAGGFVREVNSNEENE